MNKENIIDINLLKKFFNKTCSKSEQETVINWFVDSVYEQDLSIVLKKHWDEIDFDHAELDEATEKVLDKIHHQMNLEKLEEDQNESLLRKAFYYYSKIAAVLLIPVLLYAFYSNFQSSNGSSIVLPNQKIALAEINSPLGARTHFTLPDGSNGWLNSGSTLEFPVEFSGNERRVHLTGEAWFDVVKNPDIPFVVNASGVDVIALGTKFNVLAYKDSKFIDVTLESGKVIIKRKSGFSNNLIVELKPGEQVKISKKELEPLKEEEVVTKNFTSWKQGKLIIRNEKMSDVSKRLERWYNVKIDIRDKEIEDYVYRATFIDETLEEVLSYLKLTSPIDYRIKERKVIDDGALEKKEIEIFLNN